MPNAGLDEAQAGVKISGRNISDLRYTDDTTFMAESEKELRSLLMKVKGRVRNLAYNSVFKKWRSWFQSHHFMAISGEKMETVTDFIFLDSKITADGDCSHEIKKCLLLGRKDMTNLDRILRKQKQTFIKRGQSSQNYGFSSTHVWIWELDHIECWVLKNWCYWTVVLKTLDCPLDSK